MEAVLRESAFVDFGKDALYPFKRTGLSRVEGESPESLRAAVRQFVPRVPGVYGMLDCLGRLIYVGKSKALRNRLLSYFLPNNEEDKAGRIVGATAAIVWEVQPNEFAALLREQLLIRTFQPRFNVQGIPRRQQPIHICLGRLPAEQLYTSRQLDPKASCAIGPLYGASRATRAVEVLNRIFKLRDCSSKQPCGFTDQLQLFDIAPRPGCIRLEIGSCLGPCISGCSKSSYTQQVSRARAFLQGADDAPLKHLEAAMRHAAEHQHFEQAAVLREDLKAVAWLGRRAVDLAQAREQFTFIYPVAPDLDSNASAAGLPARPIWYLIRRGLIEGALAAPVTQRQQQHTEKLVQQWLDGDRCLGTRFNPRPETLALVASWFRNHRGELKKTFLPLARAQDSSHRTSAAKSARRVISA